VTALLLDIRSYRSYPKKRTSIITIKPIPSRGGDATLTIWSFVLTFTAAFTCRRGRRKGVTAPYRGFLILSFVGHNSVYSPLQGLGEGSTEEEVTMPNPRLTGISSITGKTVYIRHANEWDVVNIQDYLKRHGKEERDLTQSDVVVAAEEDRIIGFAILEKGRDSDADCVTVIEDARRRGIGAPIVRHLMEYAQVSTVYSAAGKPRYFTRLGFTRTKATQRKHAGAAAHICRWQGKRGLSLAAYEKR
jgi:N-acetylglutamate synthase-like GNAT family acetyltransferase